MTDDTPALSDQLARLTERVAALELALAAAAPATGVTGSRSADVATGAVATGDRTTGARAPDDADAFWALTGLQRRNAADPTTEDGAVMLVGSLTLPTGAPVAWQVTIGAAGLLESDWTDRAATLSALAQPVRVEILRQVLRGVTTTAGLAALDTGGTTGQLHHHLRQLLAAGWLRQSGRGSYEVPAPRVVPLLACLAGAER